jgi:hypothetical protein
MAWAGYRLVGVNRWASSCAVCAAPFYVGKIPGRTGTPNRRCAEHHKPGIAPEWELRVRHVPLSTPLTLGDTRRKSRTAKLARSADHKLGSFCGAELDRLSGEGQAPPATR